MEVAGRQDPLPALLDPAILVEVLACRAMPISTGVVHGGDVPAGVAHREMSTERGGTAAFERFEHAVLGRGQRTRGPQRCAVGTRDVAHLHAPAVETGACRAINVKWTPGATRVPCPLRFRAGRAGCAAP